MTTLVVFAPSSTTAFQFQAALDGSAYKVVVTWNLYSQRFYVNVYTLQGALVVTIPMVGSAPGLALQSLSWAAGIATAVCTSPHGYPLFRPVDIVVSGCTPFGYNGAFEVDVVDRMTLSWEIATDPGGPGTVLGAVGYDLSLVAGYFASTLVWRPATNNFEINP